MRNYEAVFVFDPELKESDLDIISDKVTSIIESSGSLIKKEVWGKRKLSYPINKKTEGVYNLFYFSGNENIPAELKRFTIINEKVLRSIVIVKNRNAFDNLSQNNNDKNNSNNKKKIQEENQIIQSTEEKIIKDEQPPVLEEQNIETEQNPVLENEN